MRPRSVENHAAASLILVLVFGCASPSVHGQSADVVDGTATYAHPEVGRLHPGRCTGTLIHPEVVLTAAHCVDDGGASDFSIHTEIGELFVPIDTVVTHPQYNDRSEVGRAHDVAVAFLAHPVHALSPPPLMTRRDVAVGDSLRLIGFGWSDREGTLTDRKHTGLADIDTISGLWVQLRREEGEAQTCPGDSGSPYLDIDTNAIIAVHARGTCRSGGDSSKGAPLWRHHSWIQDRIDEGIRRADDATLHPLIFDDAFYALVHPELESPDERRTHWQETGLRAGERGAATFDPAYYAARNGHPSFADAAAAWLEQGLAAGHRGSEEVDPGYLVQHIDDWPFDANSFATAVEHHLSRDLEYRASDTYDPVFYMSTHDDWQHLGLTFRAALVHYLTVGKPAGRPGAG